VTIETNSVVQYHLEAGVRTKERNKKYVILVEVVTVGSTVYKIIFSQSFTMNLWVSPKEHQGVAREQRVMCITVSPCGDMS
jgi:hypothetical protein